MDFDKKIVEKIKSGAIGILPTDTLYGLVGQALSKKAVAKVYRLKKRNPKKPFIILINSYQDLKLFNIKLDSATKKKLDSFWPGKVSVILPCPGKNFFYLHRGEKTLAFRMPKNKNLKELLKKTGPLIAPSANPEDFPPAKTIKQAKKYFSDKVDFYIDKGNLKSLSSTLVEIRNNEVLIVRRGAVKL